MPWRQLRRGLRALFRRSDSDRDIAHEVEHYLEEAAAAHVARGVPPGVALGLARREMGGESSVREDVRAYGWENAVEALAVDVRYALRRLRAAPGFTAIAVATLALGIGGTTAIFSALHPILFARLPYPDAQRIVTVWESPHAAQPFATYREIVDGGRSFEAVAALRGWQPTVTGPAEPERLEGQRVSASYFQVLGVRPLMGRGFDAIDDRQNGPAVVILSDRLWRRRFNGDPAIVGRPITLDDSTYQVVGVMPAGFENVLAPAAELWAPLQYDMSEGRAWGHHLHVVGRLRAGATLAEAAREVDVLGRAVAARHPEAYGPGATSVIVPLQDDLTRGIRPTLLAVFGAVLLVLLIAGVNVTNLLLARGIRRRGEFALRAALGAGRGRVVRQMLTETLLLSALGGAAGIAVAALGVRTLVALSPPDLPRAAAIAVNGSVLAFGLLLTTLAGLVFGIAPALQAAGQDPQDALQRHSRTTAGGHHRSRGALVIAEVALALVLLVTSGLLLRSLQRVFAVEPGFETARTLTLQVQTAGRRFQADGSTQRFFTQVLERVRQVPGVEAAALTSQLPLSGDLDEYGAHFEENAAAPRRTYNVFRYSVSPGYFEALGIPLRRGRLLDAHDVAGAARAVVISESLARRRYGNASPLGDRLRIGPPNGEPFTIVGVVADVKQQSLVRPEADAVYTSEDQWNFPDSAMSLVARTRGDPLALAAAVRQAVWSVDKDQPVTRIATLEALVARSAAQRRFALFLFAAFALTALALAAAGIYGLLAGSVAERTREIGLRTALGASPRRIVREVLGRGMALAATGMVLGLAGAVLASRGVATLLYGVSRLDAPTYASVILVLAAVSAIACGVPAWRATRVDPASTLRAE